METIETRLVENSVYSKFWKYLVAIITLLANLMFSGYSTSLPRTIKPIVIT